MDLEWRHSTRPTAGGSKQSRLVAPSGRMSFPLWSPRTECRDAVLQLHLLLLLLLLLLKHLHLMLLLLLLPPLLKKQLLRRRRRPQRCVPLHLQHPCKQHSHP